MDIIQQPVNISPGCANGCSLDKSASFFSLEASTVVFSSAVAAAEVAAVAAEASEGVEEAAAEVAEEDDSFFSLPQAVNVSAEHSASEAQIILRK